MNSFEVTAAAQADSELCLQLAFEPNAAVLFSPFYQNMPLLRIAISRGQMAVLFSLKGI
jgi:hypothetical protein